jgi:ATP-binding cassette subfamily B protein
MIEAAADSRTTGRLADVFTNILNLKMFSSKSREEKAFLAVINEQKTARDNAWRFQNFTYLLQGSIVSWLQIMSLYVSIVLWFQGQITLGTIVLAYSYSGTIFDSVWNLGKQMSKVSKSFSNAAEMVDIIDSPIEITDPVSPQRSTIKEGAISIDDVTFAYKQGAPVFSHLNLDIKPGEKIGIMGTSGAGKTTITKLLLRFADVTGGAIRIDGQDIRSLSQDDLRHAISYVPQDPVLFHRSIAENIAYGKTNATVEEIEDAAKLAHAHDFIKGLHLGYKTMVGERGVKLSGGERQRVAIARAILKNAPILILDEATSSLDSVSETHIKEALDTLMQGRTTIVIAHRLSTIEKMDRIIVMERGAIVEEGNHKDLLKKKGIYANFWKHQNAGFIE